MDIGARPEEQPRHADAVKLAVRKRQREGREREREGDQRVSEKEGER